MTYKIAPSILSADFAHLGQQVQKSETAGGDWLHIDVMDGHFVPNISFGPLVLRAISPLVTIPLDVHLMIERPEYYLADFARAGASHITVHQETCLHLHRVIQQIKELGLKAGVALNPATPPSTLTEILPELDIVLVMGVNPGFGGQNFIPATLAKISRLREMLKAINSRADIVVDGGVNEKTIADIASAGASVLVAGSAIFNDRASITENIKTLQQQLIQARLSIA